MPLDALWLNYGGCPRVLEHEGIPIVFITIHGVMTQFVNVSFFCVPVHEDTTQLCHVSVPDSVVIPLDQLVVLFTQSWEKKAFLKIRPQYILSWNVDKSTQWTCCMQNANSCERKAS